MPCIIPRLYQFYVPFYHTRHLIIQKSLLVSGPPCHISVSREYTFCFIKTSKIKAMLAVLNFSKLLRLNCVHVNGVLVI